MSGKRVLAVYAALLLGFMVVLCRLYLLAQHPAYAARAAAQSTVTLQLPARRGSFYDAQGQLLTGLEERWQVVCFPGQGNYDRLYACTDAAGQALLYRSRSRAAPFLLEVNCDPARLGLTGYPTARRYAAVPLCQHLLGYLDSTGHGAAGLEKALPAALAKQGAVLSGTGEHSSLVCAVTAQGTLRTGETPKLLQADSGALGVQLTISRPVQRAVEAVAFTTMQSGCILVLDTATAAVRASVSVPGYDPEHLADSLQAANSPFLNRALQSYAVGSVFKPVLAAAALDADVYENWTDVSGILMADPRIVDDPDTIERITYNELRELSYIGAQVLHEGTIFPVREKNIPLNIRNTNEPEHPGTTILESIEEDTNDGSFITGIAGKKGFSVITSPRPVCPATPARSCGSWKFSPSTRSTWSISPPASTPCRWWWRPASPHRICIRPWATWRRR